MTNFTGTNAADNLIGTAAGDTFNPLLGRDTVDGAAGFDVLTIDYSAQGTGAASTITANISGSFQGTLAADPGGANSVLFTAIEQITATLSAGNDTVTLDAAPLAGGAQISLSGGAGMDTLVADFSAFSGTSFAMGVNFLIAANRGSYAGFEQFALTLGGGTNAVTTQAGNDTVFAANGGTNTITTGAGRDVIWSTGGIDHVDGGTGIDTWHGDYSAWSANLSFGYDGWSGAGALDNGTSFIHIEAGTLVTGSGNDAFFVDGPGGFSVDGGAGTDQLIRDDTGVIGLPYAASFDAGGPGSFTGQIGQHTFTSIEQINVALSEDDNYAFVDTAPLAGGATINLDGGGGTDTLAVDFATYSGITFTVDAVGNIASPRGTFLHFETFGVALGAGTNTVVTAGGDDTVYSLGGIDLFDAGAGFDTWGGDYSAATAALTFTYDGNTAAAALSNGTAISNVEDGYIIGGAGNDSFTVTGPNGMAVIGGGGTDTLVHSDARVAGTYASSFIFAAGSSFFGSLADYQLDQVENLQVILSDDDNTVFLNAAPLATGATVSLNGRGGLDTLSVDYSSFSGTTFTVNGDGGITSNRGTFANFEQFSIGLGGGTNTVITGIGKDVVAADFGGSNSITTGDGDDEVFGGTGNDTVMGGSGSDSFHATGLRGDFLVTPDGVGGYFITDTNPADGDQGIDRLTNVEWIAFTDQTAALPAYGTGALLTGTAAADVLTGTPFADRLYGLAGNDRLVGNDGIDLFNGGLGNDTITGGSGLDTVIYDDAPALVKVSLAVIGVPQTTGGAGTDTFTDGIEGLTGSAFADTLTGNALGNILTGLAGDDRLDGGSGADTLVGGLGNDSYTVDNPADRVSENSGEGTDTVNASASFTLSANVENLTLTGTAAIDGTGNELANIMTGNGAANTLSGHMGRDVLSGGTGDDLLVGGASGDTLTGGSGADTFRFDLLETTANRDTIRDFNHSVDHIELVRSAFAGLAADPAGVLRAAEFALGAAATTASQRLIYDQATGNLWYDADGSGASAAIQLALLSTRPLLGAEGILLI